MQTASAKLDKFAPVSITRLGHVLGTIGKRKIRCEVRFVVGWTNSLVLFKDDVKSEHIKYVVKKGDYFLLTPAIPAPLDYLRYLVARALKYPGRYISSVGSINECLKEARLMRVLCLSFWQNQTGSKNRKFAFGDRARLDYHYTIKNLVLNEETQILVRAPRLRGSSSVGAPSGLQTLFASLVDASIAKLEAKLLV